MRLVLLGPPGAGKGTQGAVLSKRYPVPHISTGDLLRDAVKNNTPTGKRAKGYMLKGELVPDGIVNDIVVGRLSGKDASRGFILDGYPRTETQAQMLDGSLKKLRMKLDLVIYFETSEAVAIERLSGRRICAKCGANFHIKNIPPKASGICDVCGGGLAQRPDDSKDTVRNRLEVYEQKTKSLVDYYKARGILRKVSGDLDVDEVFKILSRMFQEERLV